MVNKLNKPAIKDYSYKVAQKICMDIFNDNKKYVGGNEILNLTNIEQVNLFVLKNLFLKWKQEIENLKSPYFDHENEEVKEALENYVNTLSQHICLDHDHLLDLLSNAISETLTLTLSPYHYFKKYYYFSEREKISLQELKELLKYIKINRIIFEIFINKLESYKMEYFLIEDIVEYYQQSFYEAADRLDDYENIMQQFSKILPVELDKLVYDLDKSKKNVVTPYTAVEKHRIDELYGEDFKKEADKIEKNEVSSVNAFMKNISDKSSNQKEQEEQEEQEENKTTGGEYLNKEEKTSSDDFLDNIDEHNTINQDQKNGKDFNNNENDLKESKSNEYLEGNHHKEQYVKNTNDNEVKEQNANNSHKENDYNYDSDDVKESESENFNLMNEKNIDIKLSINQKILFEKELFNGDTELMNRTIDKLEKAPNFEEARKIVKSMAWDDDNEASQEFYEMLEAKY